MFVPFQTLPPTSRIWIFQANRPLSSEEMALAEASLRDFTEEWNVHGHPLNTSFTIEFGQFIILGNVNDSTQSAAP